MIHLLAINRVPGISGTTKRNIAELSTDAEGFVRLCANRAWLLGCLDSGRGRAAVERINRHTAEELCERAREDASFCRMKGIHVLALGRDGYPALLSEISDPPFLLYVMGDPESFWEQCIGVVGTRQPSGLGRDAAAASGKELAVNGCTVVSGLARGVDQCAHSGAVSAGGRTVAVLGSGIDRIYPAGGKKLIAGIVACGGAVVSEYAPGTPPAKFRFPERNRIITGLSKAVLVIEAPKKSGSLITADFCIDYNRELFFHSAGIASTVGVGACSYLQDGASYVDSAAQMLKALGMPARESVSYPKSLAERLIDDLSVEEAA